MKYLRKNHLDPEKVTYYGLLRYAEEFHLSAIIVENNFRIYFGSGQIPAIPSLYLVGHSIELAFKSYLLAKGVEHKNLIEDCGHDLEECYKKSKGHDIEELFLPTSVEVGAFELLNSLYSAKQLEYIVAEKKYMPLFSLVESFSEKLLVAASKHSGYKLDARIS